ncbi:disintegrin and metalloproteinase domain-containing protein 28 [Trichonephila clavipes]|nr:disintegrin and metalloproteinase domain-containing protein 28 [Trichonephila clavipes]
MILQLRPSGHLCRPALTECDIPEFCDGRSGQCPTDLYKKNASPCNNGEGYCYHGNCPTPDNQCEYLWGYGRKRSNLTIVQEVGTAVQEESSGGLQLCSAQRISRTLDKPVSTMHKIQRNILYYPYKIRCVPELLLSKLPARDTFALEFLARMKVDNEGPWKILWLDEAHFHLTGYVNTQNCRIWETENALEDLPVPHNLAKDTVWCGFTASLIIQPYFFEETKAFGSVLPALSVSFAQTFQSFQIFNSVVL